MALFEKHLQQYTPADPLYEEYTDKRGKKRRRRREIPPGLSARDAKILKSVQRRAHYLDKGFSILGMRFGWTFIIGVIPGAGDVADISLNYLLVVRKARKADVPAWLVRKMLANNAASALMGLIPIAGDEFLRIRGTEFLKVQAEKEGKLKKKDPQLAPAGDMEQIQPGSGKEPGEVVAGEKGTKRSLTKWIAGTGSVKAKGKGKATSADTGRFVENTSEST
ncbi:hypothetical protein B0H11DRAFT_2219074 [Mycena galericulata]|nr:hypothetical protein B0H11DRAFT_2219074 [Mycena galericulata]